MSVRVTENVLGLDITVADAFSVNVSDRAQQLVAVELDDQVWHHLLHLEVVLHYSVRSVLDVVHDNVQVDLVWLLAVGVEGLTHLNAVRVVQHLEDLQLTILVALVLEDLFDGNSFASFCYRCLENYAKRAIANDFFSVVSERLLLQKKRLGIF